MKRSQPLKRSTTPIRRSRPPRARKQDPKARRWAKHRCQPYLDWLKLQPCCITGLHTGEWFNYGGRNELWIEILVDPAHIRERSLGGDDLFNCLPLARHLHNEQEGHDAEFEWKYEVNLEALALRYTERFLAEFPEHRPAVDAHRETP